MKVRDLRPFVIEGACPPFDGVAHAVDDLDVHVVAWPSAGSPAQVDAQWVAAEPPYLLIDSTPAPPPKPLRDGGNGAIAAGCMAMLRDQGRAARVHVEGPSARGVYVVSLGTQAGSLIEEMGRLVLEPEDVDEGATAEAVAAALEADALKAYALETPAPEPSDPHAAQRARLGERALALLVKHEHVGQKFHEPVCPECEHLLSLSATPHAPGCEWGRIVQEAKALAPAPRA